jgi:hypothetical protein
VTQDALYGFRSYLFSFIDMSHDVYAIGDGPPIIVLHELPGLGRSVVNFALRLSGAGFQIHLPHLFGSLGKREGYKNYRALCVSREFANLAAGVTAPITNWLRALAKQISDNNSGRSVGAIGMCLTGSFVIPLILEPCVAAPVTSQPAVPLSMLYFVTGLGGTDWARQLNVADEDLFAAADRLRKEQRKLLAFRFEEDRLCPPARFERLKEVFGCQLERHEYGGCSLFRRLVSPRHSVLTEQHNSAPAVDPGQHAFEQVCRFMKDNLMSK